MKLHTDAYGKFKKQVNATFDFSVLVSYAIPHLKRDAKKLPPNNKISTLINSDLFPHDVSKSEKIVDSIKSYKRCLSSYALISNFSFFETYVKSVIDELIKYHGGKDNWIHRVSVSKVLPEKKRRIDNISRYERALCGPYRKKKRSKYLKNIDILKKKGYDFPTDLMTQYAVTQFIKRHEKMKNMGSDKLLEFLEETLILKFTDTEKIEFDKIRKIRNDIAHGKQPALSQKTAVDHSQKMKKLAIKIDKHLVNNFFIVEHVPYSR